MNKIFILFCLLSIGCATQIPMDNEYEDEDLEYLIKEIDKPVKKVNQKRLKQ